MVERLTEKQLHILTQELYQDDSTSVPLLVREVRRLRTLLCVAVDFADGAFIVEHDEMAEARSERELIRAEARAARDSQ